MIRVKNITKAYDKIIMEDFSLDFNDNEITAILGPSGSGKTTLKNIILGLDKDFQGALEGVVGKKLSVVFQEDRLLESFNVMENLKTVNKDEIKCAEYARLFEVDDALWKFPSELSGGMKRRVALARAFAFEGDIVVMDEPFKGIDVKLKNILMARVRELVQGKICIFITHEMAEANEIATRIIVLEGNPLTVVKDLNIEKKTDN